MVFSAFQEVREPQGLGGGGLDLGDLEPLRPEQNQHSLCTLPPTSAQDRLFYIACGSRGGANELGGDQKEILRHERGGVYETLT